MYVIEFPSEDTFPHINNPPKPCRSVVPTHKMYTDDFNKYVPFISGPQRHLNISNDYQVFSYKIPGALNSKMSIM